MELIYIIPLIVGFVILIKAADIFVDGATNIAYNYKIPAVIVGLTIVAFGTSAPEVAMSISSLVSHQMADAVGNVVGSNIFNILGVIGVSALLGTLTVDKVLIKRDFPFLIISTIGLLIIALLFKELSAISGIIFLIIIIAYVIYLVMKAREDKEAMTEKVVANLTIKNAALYTIVGLIGITFGSILAQYSAEALFGGGGRGAVGLIVYALATSMPELATSVNALKKGENGIVVGNVLGSSIFNILFILGISSAITPFTVQTPIPIEPDMVFNILLMTVITIVGAGFTYTKSEVDKKEGLVLVLLYVVYLAYTIMVGLGSISPIMISL